MSILNILYWVILILAILGLFAPADWTFAPRVNNGAWIALFVIIGLKIFRTALT